MPLRVSRPSHSQMPNIQLENFVGVGILFWHPKIAKQRSVAAPLSPGLEPHRTWQSSSSPYLQLQYINSGWWRKLLQLHTFFSMHQATSEAVNALNTEGTAATNSIRFGELKSPIRD